MWLLIIVIAVIVIGIAAGISQSKNNRDRLNEEAKAQNLNRPSPRAATASTFRTTQTSAINHQCDAAGLRFAVSADRKTAYLLYDTKKPTRSVPVKDITGCEIIRDGNSAGSVGRAIAGGILAGGVGAVVGASTGSGVPQRYSLLVYINDLQNPSVEYSLLDRTTPHSKTYYETVAKFAESVAATVRVIVSQNQKQ